MGGDAGCILLSVALYGFFGPRSTRFSCYFFTYLLICNLFNDAGSNSGHTAPTDWMAVNNEMETTSKEAMVARFNIVICEMTRGMQSSAKTYPLPFPNTTFSIPLRVCTYLPPQTAQVESVRNSAVVTQSPELPCFFDRCSKVSHWLNRLDPYISYRPPAKGGQQKEESKIHRRNSAARNCKNTDFKNNLKKGRLNTDMIKTHIQNSVLEQKAIFLLQTPPLLWLQRPRYTTSHCIKTHTHTHKYAHNSALISPFFHV
jgi:hypothetical protein